MKLEDLLKKGYFPKELPPPFTTADLADKYESIKSSLNGALGGDTTRCIDYSIAKVGLVRKMIKIPNPIFQCKLSETIVDSWTDIETIFKASRFSVSRPKLIGERAANPDRFKEFVRKNFLASYPYLYELKTDISKYYPSIYTHSIPWAIHTKEIAKAKRKDKKLLGNNLDNFLQKTMYGQTIGIPIGPDTSLIIAEIIGCTIDKMLLDSFPNLKGYRYVDDMYFFCHNHDEAEEVLIKLQQILKEFELQVNTEKTSINRIPRGVEPDWIIKLRGFEFRETEIKQYNDIVSFFSLAFDLALQLPNQYVLSYAVERVKRLRLLSDNNIALMETMLLKTMIAEPSTVKEVFRILFTYKDKVSVYKIEKVIIDFLRNNCLRRNDYELSWALWIVKTFEIKLKAETAKILESVQDSINRMLILDLIQTGLIAKKDIDLSDWEKFLEAASLKNENWLFAYEMGIKKWIGKDYNYIDSTPYFKILRTNKISFYNPDLQITPVDLVTKKEEEPSIEYEQSSDKQQVASTQEDIVYEFQGDSEQDELNYEIYGDDDLDIDYLNYW